MKVLLDENLPHGLRQLLKGHEVFTVQFLGWSGLKNGVLLSNAAASGFAALVTMDSGVEYQQNVATLPLSVLILSAASNDIDDLTPLVPRLLIALDNLKPKSIVRIG